MAEKWNFWSYRQLKRPQWPLLWLQLGDIDIDYQELFNRSVGTYPSIRTWLAVQMERFKPIWDKQMVEKCDFWSNLPAKRPLWPPGDPYWIILSIKNKLVRSVGTYQSIRACLAVQTRGLKPIWDDQMAEKRDFWSIWPTNRPWRPCFASKRALT